MEEKIEKSLILQEFLPSFGQGFGLSRLST